MANKTITYTVTYRVEILDGTGHTDTFAEGVTYARAIVAYDSLIEFNGYRPEDLRIVETVTSATIVR